LREGRLEWIKIKLWTILSVSSRCRNCSKSVLHQVWYQSNFDPSHCLLRVCFLSLSQISHIHNQKKKKEKKRKDNPMPKKFLAASTPAQILPPSAQPTTTHRPPTTVWPPARPSPPLSGRRSQSPKSENPSLRYPHFSNWLSIPHQIPKLTSSLYNSLNFALKPHINWS